MKVYVGSDHAGFELKRALAAEAAALGHEVVDLGPEVAERVDYPDYAERVGRAVAAEPGARGVLCCGSGIGVAIAANKVAGVRAATVWDETSARLSREHNDANVMAVGARLVAGDRARDMLRVWLSAAFEGGRHRDRVEKIAAIEARSAKPS